MDCISTHVTFVKQMHNNTKRGAVAIGWLPDKQVVDSLGNQS